MILFCLPYAGGTKHVYNDWNSYIDENIQLCYVELKGKGTRFNEGTYIDFNDAVEDILDIFIKDIIIDQDYAIFGHSMGALLTFEIYYKIKEKNMPLPKHIFLSSMSLPSSKRDMIYKSSDKVFLDHLIQLGGFEKSILDNQELLNLCLKIIREDYRVIDTYVYKEKKEITDCGVTVMYGSDEGFHNQYNEDIKQIIGKNCEFKVFNGGHFYINNNVIEIAKLINKNLYKYYTPKRYNLLQQQAGIWYVDQINSNSAVNNIGGIVKIYGNIDKDIMEKAYNVFLKNEDMLRIKIEVDKQEPYQYIKSYMEEHLTFIDFSNRKESLKDYKNWIYKVTTTKIELSDDKLYYLAFYKLEDMKYGLVFIGHHIAFDGWSFGILQNKIIEIYKMLLINEDIAIEHNTVSIEDRLQKEKKYFSSHFHKDEEFWLNKIKEIDEKNYYNYFSELRGTRKSFMVPDNIYNKLQKYNEQFKTSLNTIFTTIMFLYMYKTTPGNSYTLGLPIYNRRGKKEKDTIGMFVNTVVCSIKIDSSCDFVQFCKLVENEIRLCLYHQQYPYNYIIKKSNIEQLGYNSLFKNSVNFYNFDFNTNEKDLLMEIDELYCGEQTYSLQMIVKQFKKECIQLCYDYKVNEYNEYQIENMYYCMMNILNQIVENPKVLLKDIQLIDEKEYRYKVFELNATEREYPRFKTTIQLFEEQVLKTPNNIAVECNSERITYQELNILSNQMANYLSDMNISKDSVVGIMMKPSIYLITCILAVLKKGAIYLPIDSDYPNERIKYELVDSGSTLLLTDCSVKSEFYDGINIIEISDVELKKYSKEIQTQICEPEDCVYIIYTSGSTGKPKGVLIKQVGLVNYLWWAVKNYLKDINECMPLFTSIAFDLTITTTFAPIISGNKIICYDQKEEFILDKIMKDNRCTVMKLTPSHLKLLEYTNTSDTKLKRLIVGGEDLKVGLAKTVTEIFNGKIEIFNEYGPTETVVGCMIHKYDIIKDKGLSVPIGYPADNVQIYILNKDMNIVPNNIPGEIYIGGDGVAKGYLNQKKMTEISFVSNPFKDGEIMYRTFDTARYLNTGTIEYLGRNDSQIKIRGYRIETGEIEKHLLEYGYIEDAVVICDIDIKGKQSLDAYIVSINKCEKMELINWLTKFLPNYMIPNRYYFIDKIPLTVNGKVDYKLLSMQKKEKENLHIDASNDVQKLLANIIKDVLKVDNINMNDSFYDIGGDSISAILISSRLKEYNYEILAKDIIMSATINEITDKMRYVSRSEVSIEDLCEGYIIKTPIINWFFNLNLYNLNWYNQYLFIEFYTDYELELINKAYNSLITYEGILRLKYDEILQEFYYDNINDNYTLKSYNLFNTGENDLTLKEIIIKLSKNISLSQGMFEGCIVHIDSNRWGILFVAHHLIVDGISWRILLENFMDAIKNNGYINKKALGTSYKNWGNNLIEYSLKIDKDERDYWKTIEELNPGYYPDSNSVQDTYNTINFQYLELDKTKLNDLIKNAKNILNMDLDEILIIGLALSINKMYQIDDIVIEHERHGREYINKSIDISNTIGWFTTIYPIHFQLLFNDLERNLMYLKEQLKKIPNKGFNYQILKYMDGEKTHNLKKYIRFNYLGNYDSFINRETIKNFEVGLSSDPLNNISSLLDISAYINEHKLFINFEYSNERYRDESINSLVTTYYQQLITIIDFLVGYNSKQFTPSDFDTVDLSFDDLNRIFN